MFDIGFTELALLAIIGLLVLGPERLPRVARSAGIYLRKARSAWFNLRQSIEQELAAEDLKRAIGDVRKEADAVSDTINRELDPKALLAEKPAPAPNPESTPEPEADD